MMDENYVHESLVGGETALEAEGHAIVVVVYVVHHKRDFRHIQGIHSDLVISQEGINET